MIGDVRSRDHDRGARNHDREHEDEEQLTTKTILSRLHQLEDAPWGDPERRRTTNWLGGS